MSEARASLPGRPPGAQSCTALLQVGEREFLHRQGVIEDFGQVLAGQHPGKVDDRPGGRGHGDVVEPDDVDAGKVRHPMNGHACQQAAINDCFQVLPDPATR